MICLQILNQKDFTKKLFLGHVFDQFEVISADFQTFIRFSLDGRLQEDFFDKEETKDLAASGRHFTLWGEVRPICCQIIKGQRTPLAFRILLRVCPATPQLSEALAPASASGSISGLVLRLEYAESRMTCTTGVALTGFSADREPELLWDKAAQEFILAQDIAVTRL